MRRKIFPYIFIRGPQVKTMLELSRDLLLPPAFHYVKVVWSSSRKSSAWGQSHHLQYSKADGSKTGIFIKLPLSVAPYSMVPSASTNRLWSLSLGYGFFFFFFEEEGKGYLLMIPRAANIKCQNTWHNPVGLISKQGRRFVSRAPFFQYISHLLPHFSYFIISDHQRESSSLWELCSRHLANLVTFVAIILLRPSLLKELFANFVSYLFFYFILSFTFIFFKLIV